MKTFFTLPTLLLAGTLVLSGQTPTADQIKSDLIGHTMGGRFRCWKFQSQDQIRQLTIKSETNHAHQCLCTIELQLQATNAPDQYAAEARVQYTKTATGWKLDQVGLLSLRKYQINQK